MRKERQKKRNLWISLYVYEGVEKGNLRKIGPFIYSLLQLHLPIFPPYRE